MRLFRRAFRPHRTAPCLACNKRYDAHQNHFHRLRVILTLGGDCPHGDCWKHI